ncbi:MAG: hypothetical protein V4621_02100 [Pseudomonadota bacterium]
MITFWKKPPAAPPSPEVAPSFVKGQVLNAAEKAALRAQALENARAARAAIGPEILDKMANLLQGKPPETSPMVQARKIIAVLDKEDVSAHLLQMMRDKTKPH